MDVFHQKPPLGSVVNLSDALARDRVLDYILNEGTGNKVFDSSKRDREGTLVLGVSWARGQDGHVLDFDGTGYIDCGTDLVIGQGNFSIVVNAKITDYASIRIFVNKRSASTGYFLRTEATSGRLYFYARATDASSVSISTVAGVAAGQWRQYAVTLDRSGVASIFIDAESVATPVDATGLGDVTETNALWIGRASALYMLGQIGDVLIYDRALSVRELEQLRDERFMRFK